MSDLISREEARDKIIEDFYLEPDICNDDREHLLTILSRIRCKACAEILKEEHRAIILPNNDYSNGYSDGYIKALATHKSIIRTHREKK